jgi:AcrR family transcriptional regulator
MKTKKKLAPATENERLAEIYRVAAEIICEKGYDATSMNDIAEAVGITKAGIYHYIEDKKSLLFAIMNYGMDRLEAAVITPALGIADAEQRLRAIITNHALLITRGSSPKGHSPVTIVVDEVAGLQPTHRRKIDQRKRAYLDLLRDTLQQLKDEGKLKEVDVTVAAFSLFGMLLWVSRWYRPAGRLTSEQVADEVLKIALGGLLRPASRLARR